VSLRPLLAPSGAASADPATAERDLRIFWAFLAFAVVLAVATATTRFQANPALALLVGTLVVVAAHRYLLAWPALLGAVIVVILFVPIRRYSLAGELPIALEPYRLLLAGVLLAWMLAVLVDPETRWRRTRLEAPLLGFAVALLASLAFNVGEIGAEGLFNPIVKQVSFLLSFVLVMYFVASVITRERELELLAMLLVAGGAVLAVASVVEWRTGFNAFDHLERFVPVLHLDPNDAGSPDRGFRTRAHGSAQHPIALGAALVLLLPLAIYLYHRFKQAIWLLAAGALTFGALATGSRTAVTMLVAELLVFLWLKRTETVRMLPLLVPLLIACQIVMPGTLGTFKAILFPEEGLIAEQQGGAGTGTGRIADIGPALDELAREPFFGQGFGTRLTSDTDAHVNAPILDDEWLGTLLEVGVIGALFLLWLYVRSVRLLARAAKADDSDSSWLTTALAAAITAFAVGMVTFDAFSFIQVTVLSFVLLGMGAVALRLAPAAPAEPARAG
jgi:hypothetical protein